MRLSYFKEDKTMGFISKLFAKKAERDAAADMYGDESHYFEEEKPRQGVVPPTAPTDPRLKNAVPMQDAFGRELPWGPVMPREENQYNCGLNFEDYFSRLFDEEFPDYQVTREPIKSARPGFRYTFTRNGLIKLYVDVISDTVSTHAFAAECRRKGIPHMNFYYNHHGWWNTRTYVTSRVRTAVGV